MKRVALIVNPFASSVTEERVRAVERELASAAAVETVRTEEPGHATALVEAAGDVDAVVVFSGDGGFNEAVNGADGRVPLGFVPGGHTNVLPRALGLPRDPVSAARLLAAALETGNTRRISLGRVNGRRFSFGAGIGLDAELVRRVEVRGRGADGTRAGDLVFAWTAVRILAERRGRFEPALEVEGLGRAAFALVANADPYTYAGRVPLRVAPAARFESGLDVVAPRRVGPQMLPRLLAYAVRGRGQEDVRDVLYGHDLDRIRIVCDAPLPLQADGEDLGDVTEAVFQCEREALAVLR